MTNDEAIASYTVRVNKGSGVLVSAMSNEYSYVITAKHVAERPVILEDRNGEPLTVIDYHPHPKADCTVIQVEYVPDINLLTRSAFDLNNSADLKFIGFPDSNAETETPLKIYKGQWISFLDGIIVCNLDGAPGQESIVGMSGGGLYHIDNDTPYLVGVEFRMDDENEDARWGRVRCYPLSMFDEIIEINGLAKIMPCFLSCFSHLQGGMFDYNVIEPQSVKSLQKALLGVADQLVRRGLPPPYELMNKYKGDLLVTNGYREEIHDKELWEAYFEFIIICALIDDKDVVDSTYIESLDRGRRMLYSRDKNNWIRKLDEILKGAKRMLDKNGTLIVSSPEPDPEMFPPESRVERIVKNISSVPTEGSFLEIDNTDNAIYDTFVITHLKALRKKCVVKNEDDFADAGPGVDQLVLFREFYNEFIK